MKNISNNNAFTNMIDPFYQNHLKHTANNSGKHFFYFKYGYTEDKERKTVRPQIVQKFEFI